MPESGYETNVIDCIAIVIALLALGISIVSFLRGRVAARVSAHLEFRQRFIETKFAFPNWWRSEELPKDAQQNKLPDSVS